ncbi:efflux RND transporter periplasmic adaptor subunit [Candidatus Roizmanbacteria bacterium]|nr:efflux RND transporter periplasmic adaptor subunit [Candidatus Roizmanbacteria bacterium]
MKHNKFSFQTLLLGVAIVLLSAVGFSGVRYFLTPREAGAQTQTVSLKSVDSQLLAQGSVRSLNEATLHFQTGGKLTYLPFKEGDAVKKGQTIASLDTYSVQKQLETALNSYRSTRDSFDQTKDNAQNNIVQGQQKNSVDASKAGIGSTQETNAINDIVKRIQDQSQANLDNSVIQVQLAQYAASLSYLTSPIDGILFHEDVTTPNINVGATTTFNVMDPSTLVFKANVPEDEISYIQEGASATITLNSQNSKQLTGTVTKIYPDKITLANGVNVYQVDITSPELTGNGMYKQNGVVLIKSKFDKPVILVPSWLVLSKQRIWVMNPNNKAELKQVTVGETIGDSIQVLSGLSPDDKLILNPQSIVSTSYLVY